MHRVHILPVSTFLLFLNSNAWGQRVAVSCDLAKGLTLPPNIGTELILNKQHSLALDASINPWNRTLPNISFNHLSVSPEYRYWLQRSLYAHYIGFHASMTAFDLRFRGDRSKGYFGAAGISYGYSFLLDKR